MKRKNVDMLTAPIIGALLSMTIPIMIMNVTQTLFNILDMMVLKTYSTEMAVGAVGACSVLNTLCTNLLVGLSVGANVIVAKRIGADDRERTNQAATTSIMLSLVGGIFLMLVGTVFAENFLRMTNCHESLLPRAAKYFRTYFYGVPALMLYTFLASILRAIGDTKRPMYFLIISGVVKVLFTLLFVGVFHMDVEGVALATIVSNVTSCILTLLAVLKRRDVLTLNLKNLRMHRQELREILRVGVPAGIQHSLYALANVVITATVNTFGAAATTGVAIANQFDAILYHISCAPALAAVPFVAQNMGAGNLKRVRQTVLRAMLITVTFGVTFGLPSAMFSRQLSSLMASDPAVIAFSRQKMIIISSTYFICGINEMFCGVLRGLGKQILPTVSVLVFMCLFRFVWVYAIFPLYPNLTFLYAVWPVGWVLSIAVVLCGYLITMSKLEKTRLPVPEG